MNRALSWLIWIEARLVWSWLHALIWGGAVVGSVFWARDPAEVAWPRLYNIAEPLYPLLSGATFVALVMADKNRRTLPLIAATLTSVDQAFARRFVLNLLYCIGAAVLAWALLQLAPSGVPPEIPDSADPTQRPAWLVDQVGGPNGLVAVLMTLAAPALFLGALGTCVAHGLGDVRAGYLTIFALWMLSRLAGLQLDASATWWFLHLTARSAGSGDWMLTKFTQLGLAAVGFGLATWLLVRPERLLSGTHEHD